MALPALYSDGSSKEAPASFSLAADTSAATITPDGSLTAGAVVAGETVRVNAAYTEGGIAASASLDAVIAAQGVLGFSRAFNGYGESSLLRFMLLKNS